MRHNCTFARAAALLIALGSPSFAQWRCSSSTIRGTWAYQGRGTVMMLNPGSASPAPVPLTGLGSGKIDSDGRYTIRATISTGGQIQEVEFSGSIQVNPDCTATAKYTLGSTQGTDRLIIVEGGNEMYAMPTSFPLGPFAGVFSLRRVAWGEARCGSYMVRGVYAGPREGTQMMAVPGQSQLMAIPFSAIHTATFQSGGTGSGESTASLGGSIVNFDFSGLSMVVNPDCTARMKYTATSKQFPGQTFTGAIKYVVLDNGSELIGMDTEANPGLPAVVLDNLKRISMTPRASER